MIRCEQVSKVYRSAKGEVRSLECVQLEVRSGEFVCVRGPSGCGKTTLLLTLGAMLRPTSGGVRIAGTEIYELSARERARFRAEKIGFIFQMFHLIPYLSVSDNVLLAARPTGDGDVQKRATGLLEQFGLAARQQHTPAELSAGERQRTAIARALLNQPQLILADEPTGNLDPENASDVFQHLKVFTQTGGTVVVVTHGSTAESFADRIVEMRAGRILPILDDGHLGT
jgi:ABC-type lipoprotein export system ATPase subunit